MVGGGVSILGSPGAKVKEVMFHAAPVLVLPLQANYCQGILDVSHYITVKLLKGVYTVTLNL